MDVTPCPRQKHEIVKIGLVSDTHMPHSARRLPDQLVRAFREQRPDIIAHMGDFTSLEVRDMLERFAPVEAIAGNNDGPDIVRIFGRRKILEVGDVRIGMVHGDGSAKTTVERAWRSFSNEKVHAVLFGHSHIPYCEQREGVWLVNPGSPTDKRRNPLYSYGMLEVKNGQIIPKLYFFARDGRSAAPDRRL